MLEEPENVRAKQSFPNSWGCMWVDEQGGCRRWLAQVIYCSNNSVPIMPIPGVFPLFFCKYERPCPDSDFKGGSGRPHTRPRSLRQPFPSTHQTQDDKRSSRWHNETYRSFQLCVKCDIHCLLVTCVDIAACVLRADQTVQAVSLFLVMSHQGHHQTLQAP